MGIVNSPRPCVVCGKEFYPSISKSLFVCDDPDCGKAYNQVMEEIDDNRKKEDYSWRELMDQLKLTRR